MRVNESMISTFTSYQMDSTLFMNEVYSKDTMDEM
jgi:hypothetical protein